ncbi:SLOG family protein [Oscillibacter sp.]|uniref:SLOG family protein n=1 Tax=Oscillibacter sp. TaxID=1945593 RepID=UPI00289F874C|nr:SLOG family protein [Oscillibacter sp.]
MSEKACCVTGHRDIPADKVDYVKSKLKEEIEKAIADGFTMFISGFAEGVDLLFAELVLEQKAQHPDLFLEAAIPYNNRLKSTDPLFRKCLEGCNGIKVQQEEYSQDCFMNRNRYMVALSSRVIAVYDGRDKGGTLSTMRYAHTMEREVREIRI